MINAAHVSAECSNNFASKGRQPLKACNVVQPANCLEHAIQVMLNFFLLLLKTACHFSLWPQVPQAQSSHTWDILEQCAEGMWSSGIPYMEWITVRLTSTVIQFLWKSQCCICSLLIYFPLLTLVCNRIASYSSVQIFPAGAMHQIQSSIYKSSPYRDHCATIQSYENHPNYPCLILDKGSVLQIGDLRGGTDGLWLTFFSSTGIELEQLIFHGKLMP